VAAPYAAVIATATVRERAQKVICSLLRQVIVQRERVLHPVAHGRTAVSTEALELSSCGTREHRKGLLRLAVLEYPDALEHKGSGLGTDSCNDSLEADERRRAILQIHHWVFDLPSPLDIRSEAMHDAGPTKPWPDRPLTARP